ncbi:hypothetical protein KRP22_005824 [Phytophthora ramorum]|nr:hypothetical protein KRP22_3044 [Phytophthora ramorum]
MTQLEVVLQNGIKMEYPNPVNHACFSIGECDEWHPAKLLLWWDLPANSVAMFFEDANCYSDTLKYNNPKSWHCLDFKTCSYWQPAKSISWVDLPYDKFAVFFETRDCRAEGNEKCVAGGQFHYITDMNDLDATQKLKTARVFRSMMVRESVDSTLPPSVAYTNRCSSTFDDKESTSVDGSSVAANEPNITGNLSSNWYAVLSSTSLPLKNGSSSYCDTATILND